VTRSAQNPMTGKVAAPLRPVGYYGEVDGAAMRSQAGETRSRIGIIGAGPAGAAAALRLGQLGVPDVVLVDRDEFPRDKTCGSGVSPKGINTLKRLGVCILAGEALAAIAHGQADEPMAFAAYESRCRRAFQRSFQRPASGGRRSRRRFRTGSSR
jgi:threonine dehydrogenase-like Zn-dependent dehydrogenase